MMEWVFPPTGGGTSYGFNDASQEHFRADALEHAVRETIQNSLDAKSSGHDIVKISIRKQKIRPSDINAEQLAIHVEKCIETESGQNPDAADFYKNTSMKILRQKEIPVLSMVDSNTTGLVGDAWDSLIYKEGTPNKPGTGFAPGGSFGIGKNAPYTISGLRMVCYSTRYLSNSGRVERFIARCKLSAHPNPEKSSEELQNVGFGGVRSIRNSRPPPLEGKDIPSGVFKLKSQGTGIFVIGFKFNPNFVSRVSSFVTRHFFTSIHERKLEVAVDSTVINHQTLDGIFDSGRPGEPSRHYYHTIREPKKTVLAEPNLGNFNLFLSTGDEHAPNRVAYVNRRGMLITDERTKKKNPFRVNFQWGKYSAVLMAADDATDKKIRKMEPPDHRSIEAGRLRTAGPDRLMKDGLNSIQKKLTEYIESVLEKDSQKDEVILDELANLLSIPGSGTSKDGDHEPVEEFQSREKRPSMRPSKPVMGHGGGSGGGGNVRDGSVPHVDGTAGTDGTPNTSGSIRDGRIVRVGNTLRVAFTPSAGSHGVDFTIKPAGEERFQEPDLQIDRCVGVTPEGTDVDISNNTVHLRSKTDRRIILDIPIKNRPYTGYEIVEIQSLSDGGKA